MRTSHFWVCQFKSHQTQSHRKGQSSPHWKECFKQLTRYLLPADNSYGYSDKGFVPVFLGLFSSTTFQSHSSRKKSNPWLLGSSRKWSGLARSANPALLFLPPKKRGLGLPSLTNLYKKQPASKFIQLLSSQDTSVRAIAHQSHQCERSRQRQKFRPAETALTILEADPCIRRRAAVRRVRGLIATEDDEELLNNLMDLPQQGEMVRYFAENSAAVWANCLKNLPPEPMRFVLNAVVDTLPTNSNLHKWKKRPSSTCHLCQDSRQSLVHVLNNCPKAMALRRYSARHDDVLRILADFVRCYLPPTFRLTVDLPDHHYSFPQDIAPTTLRPDIVWWSEEMKVMWILELTISFETVMDQAHSRKVVKYDELVGTIRRGGFRVGFIALEVGSRGLIVEEELSQLQGALDVSRKAVNELAVSLTRCAILGSFKIWCSRNHLNE